MLTWGILLSGIDELSRRLIVRTHAEFRVSVSKDYLVFAAAHFITLSRHRHESLHGHNYRVGVVLEGSLDPESSYVVDFGVVKNLMRRLCDEIDHKVLLPLRNSRLGITTQEGIVSVALDGKPRYAFPEEDCAMLDIPNTTVEMLAQYLLSRVRTELSGPEGGQLTAVELEVEENFGQSAICRERLV